MRWLRFEYENTATYGIAEDDEIAVVSGTPFGDHERTGQRLPISEIKLLVPLEPRTFYAVGQNYLAHVRETVALFGGEFNPPTQPDIGYRATNALIADGEAIVIPNDATEQVQYEGELVAVIGKRAKGLSEADALDCVFGYSIGNDVSERSWQKSDRTIWRAKNTDSFKPMGPWIETEVRLETLRTRVRVNGEVRSDFATNEMIFGVARFIATMSRYLTLYPGDMIWMGTDGPTENIKPGDEVAIEIDGIGVLRNPVVGEA